MGTNLDKMIEYTLWGGKNMAYNIDFIPDDKFDWKPEKTAKSAQDLVNHVIQSFRWAQSTASGKDIKPTEVKIKEAAKKELLSAAEDYAQMLKSLSAKDLAKPCKVPWGEISTEFMLDLAVIDVIHHRGQLVYIQTLLGDTDDHFQM